MVDRRLLALLVAVAALTAAGGLARAASPFDPFKELWHDPRGTMHRVTKGTPAAPPPTEAPPGDEAAATTPPASDAAAAAEPAPQKPPVVAAVPLPRLRPNLPDHAARSVPVKAEPEVDTAPLALLPPERPAIETPFPDAARPLRKTVPRVASLGPLSDESASSCARGLAAIGIDASPLAPISEGACGVKAPAAVVSIDNGAVTFTDKAIVNCAVASAVAAWVDEEVQPAALRLLGGRVTALRIAASYECRGRNRIAGAQLSEHAFGNAIDISGFKVDGVGWIEVGKTRAGAAAAFLATIRKAACGPFTTVLGPGVAYHDEHFHLDLAKRRTAGPSKGLYCK